MIKLLIGIAIGYLLPGDIARGISFIKYLFGKKIDNVINIKDKL